MELRNGIPQSTATEEEFPPEISNAEGIRNRKNFPTTVAAIMTEGRGVPDQVTLYRRLQKPERFILKVIQYSRRLKVGHTKATCRGAMTSVSSP